MDLKGAINENVDKVVDHAAKALKDTAGSLTGKGDKKAPGDTKPGGEGVGDMISGALNKAATDVGANKAANEAKSFGKKLFN